MSAEVKKIKADYLSKYKTFHHFENYGEVCSLDDYTFYIQWAKQNNKDIYILGNGSNTLFTKKKVRSLVLKNSLPKEIKCTSNEHHLYEVSLNVMMHEILNYCFKNSLDSFYYLASVPATIGGALAMNAGEGKHINKAIYDFVESVTYIDTDGSVQTIKRQEMNVEYRKTMFTGHQDKFIVGAVFKFPQIDLSEVNPIKDRIQWAKHHQDNVAPNCGSVFNEVNGRILNWLKGFRIGGARYSGKCVNWINNNSGSTIPILSLITAAKILHFIFRKKCKLEVIRVK